MKIKNRIEFVFFHRVFAFGDMTYKIFRNELSTLYQSFHPSSAPSTSTRGRNYLDVLAWKEQVRNGGP